MTPDKKINNILLQVIISVMLTIITIFSTYFIIDYKLNIIKNEIIAKILPIPERQGFIEGNTIIAKSNQPTVSIAKKIYNGNQLPLETVKIITTQNTYVLGNPDAEITWIEYSDLECPFCKKLHTSGTIGEIMKIYGDKINFIFKQFPLKANSPKEHESLLCAGELGGTEKYYEYLTEVFSRTTSNGRGFALNKLIPLAVEIGLNETKFRNCLVSGKYANQLTADTLEGSRIFGISGTPGNVFINNKTGVWDKLPGAYPTAAFKEKIDTLLQ